MVLAAEKSRLLLLVKMLKEKQQISVEKKLFTELNSGVKVIYYFIKAVKPQKSNC